MISFSGIDCGGKSTQILNIYNILIAKGVKCKVIHSRGGYTPCLEFVKTLIRRDKSGNAEDHEQYRKEVHGNPKKRKLLLWLSILDLGLYYGIHFRMVELFGYTILADRYFWDSYIDFQMKYPEFDFEKWKAWKFAKKIYLKPKTSIIYTIPAELSMHRSSLKDEPWPEPVEVRRDRISRYEKEIENNRWQHCVDATVSIEEVLDKSLQVVKPLFRSLQ